MFFAYVTYIEHIELHIEHTELQDCSVAVIEGENAIFISILRDQINYSCDHSTYRFILVLANSYYIDY